MPRPSIAKQRKEEILDAFEQCILNVGIDATSLEYLAEQAGMKRTILRHFIGNKDDIIIALSKRHLDYYAQLWDYTIDSLPADDRLRNLIEFLFSERDEDYIQHSEISHALFSQARRLNEIAIHQQKAINQSKLLLTEEMKRAMPNVDNNTIDILASNILACYIHSESLLQIGMNDEIEFIKQSCLKILEPILND